MQLAHPMGSRGGFKEPLGIFDLHLKGELELGRPRGWEGIQLGSASLGDWKAGGGSEEGAEASVAGVKDWYVAWGGSKGPGRNAERRGRTRKALSARSL